MRLETAVRRRLRHSDDPLLRELALRLARAIETAPGWRRLPGCGRRTCACWRPGYAGWAVLPTG